MNKILLIIKREYLSRVRKKSFIIMTILGPVLMAGLILAPILLMDSSDEEKRKYGFVMKIIFLNLNLKMLMEPIISFLRTIFFRLRTDLLQVMAMHWYISLNLKIRILIY